MRLAISFVLLAAMPVVDTPELRPIHGRLGDLPACRVMLRESFATSSVSGSANTLTLTVSIAFSSSFAGNQVFFQAARNSSTGDSGCSRRVL